MLSTGAPAILAQASTNRTTLVSRDLPRLEIAALMTDVFGMSGQRIWQALVKNETIYVERLAPLARQQPTHI
jgi:hypothetical protein